jgi:short-subunit dehydrogenase
MARLPRSPASIVITGASSGIGRALAIRYARAGVTLGLTGRSASRLQDVAAECRRLGATVDAARLDVRQREEVAGWLREFDSRTPIDLLIANAGMVTGISESKMELPSASHELLETNLLGALNAVHAILPAMLGRGQGQIAFVSSLAAFFPLTDMPSYSASKAALFSYGLALRQALGPHGIGVSVICPGYVETEISRQQLGPKPFSLSADAAARLIVAGLDRNRAVITFPRLLSWAARFGGLLPENIRRWAAPRFTVIARQVSD